MLKLLTVIAVVFSIAQAGNPATRKAPDKYAGTGQTVKQKPPATPVIQSVKPQRDQFDKTIADAEAQKPVRISEFPSVSITSGWRENLALIFNGALLIVGIFGVRAAIKTLGVILRQAALMEGQIAEAKAQVALIAEQNATTRERERARISIHILSYDFETPANVSYKITCHGFTVAKVKSSYEMTSLLPIYEIEWREEAFGFKIQELPQYLSGTEIIATAYIMQTEGRTIGEINEEIEKRDLWLQFRVRIRYEDIYGEDHETSVSQAYGRPPQSRFETEFGGGDISIIRGKEYLAPLEWMMGPDEYNKAT